MNKMIVAETRINILNAIMQFKSKLSYDDYCELEDMIERRLDVLENAIDA